LSLGLLTAYNTKATSEELVAKVENSNKKLVFSDGKGLVFKQKGILQHFAKRIPLKMD